ncbi:AAA family ATPase [Pelagibacterium halotolerans]|uniref:ORC1/DEAH AAA+ ATPase domain-containing protein n=1 Tax=Pelagibacterium halotolerans (strain DSM 22347 / JCM 15775 / CGMCC 1.7692 / B2) TaxID=1082931 RepID=G4RDY9_PELHB|nr:ATP-binding protein [Pelagibacterium halotolerans]AEQ50783.1 hypothetical protein KKY_744 [Pelagibacterium halotolerans B2]SDZ95753.1 AAA domain-containing protein [Pelagibacterium halotolerans]
MSEFNNVNKAAPLRNVAAFSILIKEVVERDLALPGMAVFSGPSGYGKTKAAIKGANAYRAAYVECHQLTTARSLLKSILEELGVQKPKGTATDMLDEAIRLMAGDIRRPIIIDEVHHIAHKKFVDVARALHDKSMAPVILIGEETLPKQLEAFERVHNRILSWVQAEPCDLTDFAHLARLMCPGVSIAGDLAQALIDRTRGNTRRIAVNLSQIDQRARRESLDAIDLEGFGGVAAIRTGQAPARRLV